MPPRIPFQILVQKRMKWQRTQVRKSALAVMFSGVRLSFLTRGRADVSHFSGPQGPAKRSMTGNLPAFLCRICSLVLTNADLTL